MAERPPPSPDLDDLSWMDQLPGFERFGLTGLPDALDSYDIHDPTTRAEIAQAIAITAFKELSVKGKLHPDQAGSHAPADNAAHFREIFEAIQHINEDPGDALQALVFSQAPGRERREQVRTLRMLKELQEKIGDQREVFVDTLYTIPYYGLFDIAQDEELIINVSPITINRVSERITGIATSEEDYVRGETTPASIDVRLAVQGDEIGYLGSQIVPLNANLDPDLVAAHNETHRDVLEETDALMIQTLENVRIIGAYTQTMDEEHGHISRGSVYLNPGPDDRNPLSIINGRPASLDAVDRLRSHIPKQTRQNVGFVLMAARCHRNGELTIGPLGSYNVVP